MMSEIPYRDVVEGAKLFMKIPLEKQLKLIEIILNSVPADIKELVDMITDELGVSDIDNVREVMAFTLAVVKSIASKGAESVVKDLRHMGFTEAGAKALVDKILKTLPTAEKDAEVIRGLDLDKLTLLAETWVDFFTGEYGSLEEWSRETELPPNCLVAAVRFFESMLKSIVTGEISPGRLVMILVEDYGFSPEQAQAIVEVMSRELDNLSRVLMFKLLYKILDSME